MSKKKKKERSVSEAVKASNKKANIIVAVIVGITALILITIAVLCSVRVDPLDGVAKPDEKKSEYYELYDVNGTAPLVTTAAAQSKIRTALGGMDFSIMNAILQWNWDYSYNFVRNSDDKKITLTAEEVTGKLPSAKEYMVEYVYENATVNGTLDKAKAHSLKVDGETVYFDRLKVLIGDTDNSVGEIYLYPYVYELATNKAADDGIPYETYRVTPIKVRANTTETYKALGEVVSSLKAN